MEADPRLLEIGRLSVLYRVPPSVVLSWPRQDIEFLRDYFRIVPEPDGYMEAALIRHAVFASVGADTKLRDHYYRFTTEEESELALVNFLGG